MDAKVFDAEMASRELDKFCSTWGKTKRQLGELINIDFNFLESIRRKRISKRPEGYAILFYHLKNEAFDPRQHPIRMSEGEWNAFVKQMRKDNIRPLVDMLDEDKSQLEKSGVITSIDSIDQEKNEPEDIWVGEDVSEPVIKMQELYKSMTAKAQVALLELLEEAQVKQDLDGVITKFRQSLTERLTDTLEDLDELLPFEEELIAIANELQKVLERIPYRRRAIEGRKALGYDN